MNFWLFLRGVFVYILPLCHSFAVLEQRVGIAKLERRHVSDKSCSVLLQGEIPYYHLVDDTKGK